MFWLFPLPACNSRLLVAAIIRSCTEQLPSLARKRMVKVYWRNIPITLIFRFQPNASM